MKLRALTRTHWRLIALACARASWETHVCPSKLGGRRLMVLTRACASWEIGICPNKLWGLRYHQWGENWDRLGNPWRTTLRESGGRPLACLSDRCPFLTT